MTERPKVRWNDETGFFEIDNEEDSDYEVCAMMSENITQQNMKDYMAAWHQLYEAVVKDGQLITIRDLAAHFMNNPVVIEDESYDLAYEVLKKAHNLNYAVRELIDRLNDATVKRGEEE